MTWGTDRKRVPILFAALLLGTGVPSHLSAEGAVEVSIEISLNPLGEGPPESCRASALTRGAKQQWWAWIDLEEIPLAGSRRLGCGAGALAATAAATEPEQRKNTLGVEMNTTAGYLPANLTPERVMILDLWVTKLLSRPAIQDPGDSAGMHLEDRRQFYFLDEGTAFLPLRIFDEEERQRLGFAEVVVAIAARPAEERSDQQFGRLVLSGVPGTRELFIDGGSIGWWPEGESQVVIEPVPAGWRRVRLRRGDGAEVERVVEVLAGRTSILVIEGEGTTSTRSSYDIEPIGKNEAGFEEYRRHRDGAVVVRIPGGEFLMGNRETERTPFEHLVHVSEFLIDKLGVTWSQYKRFAAATGVPLPPRDPYWGMHDDHPAVFVTWEEAKSYCEWAGGRLPTEAEREKAARGLDRRKYPWGDEEPTPELGVFRSEWGYEATAPVGTHPAGASPYGLLDMGGNVWEWCSDWYDETYFETSPYRDPQGPKTGIAHVLRGGSWDSRPSVLSASCRNFGHRGYRELDFGFRCAMNAPE